MSKHNISASLDTRGTINIHNICRKDFDRFEETEQKYTIKKTKASGQRDYYNKDISLRDEQGNIILISLYCDEAPIELEPEGDIPESFGMRQVVDIG